MNRTLRILSLLLFLLPLLAPQGLELLGVPEDPQALEKRRKDPLPPLSLAATDFKAFAAALTKNYALTFPYRDILIRTANLLKMDLFQQSPMKSVILGRDGWLFFNDEMDMEDWLNVTEYSQEELDNAVAIFTERGKWLARQGSAMLVVIAPNKPTLYGEFLPPLYHKLGKSPRLDQLAAAFTSAGIPFLDLRPALEHIVAEFPAGGPAIELELTGDTRLPGALAGNVLHVVREALANAIRHADATRVLVRSSAGADGLGITVEDDGRGFDPDSPSSGLGMGDMRERAAWCEGRLHVRSAPGRGTEIRLAVPAKSRVAT